MGRHGRWWRESVFPAEAVGLSSEDVMGSGHVRGEGRCLRQRQESISSAAAVSLSGAGRRP